MVNLRLALIVAVVVVAAAALMGCSTTPGSTRTQYTSLPTDLPADPEPCTRYCKVWVPPVVRKKPCVVMTKPGYTEEVPECVMEPRYREVCVRERCQYGVKTPGKQCDKAVVQVRPGGYKWKRDGDCWRYCYEEPCYQWCNKVVTEEGIEYCMEVPPEYRVDASLEPVTRYRTVYHPPEYGVKYVDEVHKPGHYEWQPTKECESCDCPAPCPVMPCRPSPCPPGSAITYGVPRTN